jgi:hypothetical protein
MLLGVACEFTENDAQSVFERSADIPVRTAGWKARSPL